MHTTNLHAFIAAADTSSFSRAAARLHLTQPAVSKRIAQLEQELGTRLFDRIGRRIALTEAGQALLPRARRILSEVDDSVRAIHNLSGQVAGRLSLGTSHHIGLHRLPPLLRAYTARHPEVELDLQFLDSETACQAVAHGSLELAIITLPLELPPHLRAAVVWPDPLCFVCAPAHPLAAKKRLTPQELVRHPALLPARHTTTREILEQAFAPLGAAIQTSVSTNYLETLKMMASIGLGWSLLPRTLIDAGLHELRVNGMRLERRLGVVHHGERTLSNAARRMMSMLQHETTADHTTGKYPT